MTLCGENHCSLVSLFPYTLFPYYPYNLILLVIYYFIYYISEELLLAKVWGV